MNKEIKKKYYKELEPISYEELKKDCSNEILIELIEKNIIKSISSKNIYYFDYVGVIKIDNIFYIILPKYLSSEEIKEEKKNNLKIKLILEVLKNNNKESCKNSLLNLHECTIETNDLFGIYDYLIADYIEYGLYEVKKEISELNGYDNIDWEKTIDETEVIINKNVPIYLNYFTISSKIDETNDIRELHKYYLNKACFYFKEIDFLDLNYPIFNFPTSYDVKDIELNIFKIKQELSEEFSERKIRLLKVLLLLLENEKKNKNNDNYISFYGTNSFYHIWEIICSEVLGNQYEFYKKYINKPIWYNSNNEVITYGKTLIPDIIINRNNILYIFDAKYYNPNMSSGEKLPGIEAIGKQYLYELAFLNVENIPRHKKNIFLFPSTGNNIEYIGKVEINFLKKIGNIILNDIKAFKLPDKKFFEYYLKKIKLSDQEFEKFI